jgi:ankyrin repeat protein
MKKYLFLLISIVIFVLTFEYHIGSTQVYKDLRHSVEVDLPYDTVLENIKSPVLARLLVKIIDVNVLNFRQQTLPLISQIQHYNDSTNQEDKDTFFNIVSIYLKHGANVNKALSNGNSALFYVEDVKMYELLKEYKVDINHKNKRGENAYFTAANNLVRYALINDGIALRVVNIDGQNLLHMTESDFSARALVDKGVDINQRDKYDMTPIMKLIESNKMRLKDVEAFINLGASFFGTYSSSKDDLLSKAVYLNPEVASLLLDHNIDISLRAIERGFQRLSFSTNRIYDTQLLKRMIENYKSNDMNSYRNHLGETFLHMAVSIDFGVVKALLKKGMNVNAINKRDETALFYVKRFDITELLIEYGASVFKKNIDGKLILDLHKDQSIREYLVKTQLSKSKKSKKHLLSYMQRNHKTLDENKFKNEQALDIIRFYVEHGESIKVKDKNRRSLLFYANTPEIMKYLIEKGVKVESKDRFGETVIWNYMRFGREDLAQALIDHGINLETRNKKNQNLFFAVKNESLVPILVNIGLDINHKDKDTNTPLHVINSHVSKKILEVFFNNEAKLDIKNRKGEISLFNFLDSQRNFDYLMDQGADVYSVNKRKDTLLHKAVMEDSKELVDYLLNQDLGINDKNIKNCTPFDYAQKGLVYDRLIAAGAKKGKGCHK